MASDCILRWADRFEQMASLTLGPLTPASFRDAACRVTRKRTVNLLLARLAPGFNGPLMAPGPSLDEQLLAARTNRVVLPVVPDQWQGSFLERGPTDAIEVWTETELAAVHAAWSLPGWHEGAIVSARWLLDEIQPDNATNLPWAAHVFAWLSCAEANTEAGMYAETLMHNCMVGMGKPDALSALILADSAASLRSK